MKDITDTPFDLL